MLSTREEILSSATDLASHLKKNYKDYKGEEWTRHIFKLLEEFCIEEFGLHLGHIFHAKHIDGRREFLWDFLAASKEHGILMVAESEQESNNEDKVKLLEHDFEKLFYVQSPLRILICKATGEDAARELLRELTDYANQTCVAFHAGSVLLVHFCLWNEKGSQTYICQTAGNPARTPSEIIEFKPI